MVINAKWGIILGLLSVHFLFFSLLLMSLTEEPNRRLYISPPKQSPCFIGTVFLTASDASLSFSSAFSGPSSQLRCSGSHALSGPWHSGMSLLNSLRHSN